MQMLTLSSSRSCSNVCQSRVISVLAWAIQGFGDDQKRMRPQTQSYLQWIRQKLTSHSKKYAVTICRLMGPHILLQWIDAVTGQTLEEPEVKIVAPRGLCTSKDSYLQLLAFLKF